MKLYANRELTNPHLKRGGQTKTRTSSPPVTLKIPQHLHSLTRVRWSVEKLGNSRSAGVSQKFLCRCVVFSS